MKYKDKSIRYFDKPNMVNVQELLVNSPEVIAQRELMLSIMEVKKEDSVLDIGSGNGVFINEISKLIGKKGFVCGLDLSKIMLAKSIESFPNIPFVCGDSVNLPIVDNYFDLISCRQVLSFITEIENALIEIYRILKPGGRAIIFDTDWGTLEWRTTQKELMKRAIRLLLGKYADPQLPLTITDHLKGVGFETLSVYPHKVYINNFSYYNYAGQTFRFIEKMMEDNDSFSEDDRCSLKEDQRTIDEAGKFSFVLDTFIFACEKPG